MYEDLGFRFERNDCETKPEVLDLVLMTAPRILVADDQTDILQALRLLLTDAGFETDLVSSVGGVLDRVVQRPYDLLLMDLNYTRDTTSGREGLELLERVRTHDGTLPVVVMTGWGSIDTAVEAMRRGARSFVQKPWDDLTLVEVVRREVEDGMASRRRDAKLAREHDEANLIQRALLPSTLPEVKGCRLAALWTPASGIGGDCYDVFRFTDTRVAVSIADVVGKGLPAALLMSNLQAAVRAFSTAAAEPHDVCASVNRLLCRNIASGKFVTFCYAVIDTSAMTIAYANAGHFPPILMRTDGRAERLAPTGLVLGVAADWSYTSGVCEITPGDRLICYTDGITEALAPDGGEFGEDRLLDTSRAYCSGPPDRLARAVSDAVSAWTGGSPQDDATLIVAAIE
jgi:sigma-B regulation protein RsbU (phosphoserine phosphatase)